MVDVEYLGLIIAVAVVLVGAVVGLVATRGRGRRTPTLDRKGPPEVVAPADTEAEAEPGVGDDAAVPRDTPTRTVEDAELPTVEAPPPVEKPESTAGRLQNKAGLMDELGKVKRVVEKQAAVSEVLLVLDATTGQNGMTQARVFGEVVDVTGIVLTKLDGSAKGGIVVAVQRELGVPVKLVGIGEGADDLAPFDPEAFVDALLGGDAAAA